MILVAGPTQSRPRKNNVWPLSQSVEKEVRLFNEVDLTKRKQNILMEE